MLVCSQVALVETDTFYTDLQLISCDSALSKQRIAGAE
jgi:hypothetical protein